VIPSSRFYCLGRWLEIEELVSYSPNSEEPHPNPPLGKGRELDYPVSPLNKGGIEGGLPSLETVSKEK
jgi:hypothetical protein